MDYTYRSPLQDQYYEHDNQYERGHQPPSYSSNHRGYKPYARPGPSSQDQGPTYSSRYKLSSYPKELNDMFGALECKLCFVEVSSPIVAKMHYSGKQHMKKVKNFLTEWSLKTGNSIDSFQNLTTPSSAITFPAYCELCDVRLLSTNDKIAHCSGKQHKKNERDPSNAKKKKKSYDTIDLSATDARFGIGTNFSSNIKTEDVPDIKVKDFVCELCDVKAVSQEQLDIHLGGKNHQHRLKKKESVVVKPDRPYKCDMCSVAFNELHLLNVHLQGKPHEKRAKKLETEFIGDSCKICDIDFITFREYQMHMNGKRHEKKCRQNAFKTTFTVKDQKTAVTCRNCPYVGNQENHLCDGSLENSSIEKGPDAIWECVPCYNMVFDDKDAYEEHKKTRRHLLCTLNVEGDKISEEIKHWYCFVCRKQYHSHKEYCDHLFEQKHMTLTNETCDLGNKTDLFYCSVCAVIIDQQAINEHMMSKSHLLQAAQQDITNILTEMATVDLKTQSYHCSHCTTTFFSFMTYCDHMLAQDHLEKIISMKLTTKAE